MDAASGDVVSANAASGDVASANAAHDGRTTVWLGVALVALATAARLVWVLTVPTVPTSDFAMYRESANHLSELGRLDHGFIYMPGYVGLLAWVQSAGGDLLAQKLVGVAFGGLGAAGLFALALGLFESRRVAVVATFLYALWPAGVAMSSVVGTDMPAAALIAAALGALAALGPRRPLAAAVAFGGLMGCAAWMRAVALPLSALSLGTWLAWRARWPAALARTGVAVGATLLVLLPWGLRHARQTGHLYFTDDHGGLTAIVGANPNSEGTYSRALNRMFKDLTGRDVLSEPHRDVDRLAFALASDWTRFEPAYTLGLATKRLERFFEPERRLLYWPVFRPGVLVGPKAAWFAGRAEPIGAAADAFGLGMGALAVAGLTLAAWRRRWPALTLVPFGLALTATYMLFFAEPRYRLPVELLSFPFVALALVELAALAAALARRTPSALHARAPGLAVAAAVVVVVGLAWNALDDFGAGLRARHRWAATIWRADGVARLAKWRPADDAAVRSPVEGLADGARLSVDGARATRVLVDLGDASLPAGGYELVLAGTASAPVHVSVSGADGRGLVDGDVAPGAPFRLAHTFSHAGGPLRLTATLTARVAASVTVNDLRIDRSGVAAPERPGS